MSKNQITFKIIELNPSIPNIDNYNFLFICSDTKFKDSISYSKNNSVTDKTNLTKSLKYIIKLTKKEKILGVGNLLINHDIFTKKIKNKIYRNINLFITENNYKKIFPQTIGNKIRQGIILSIEVNIKYNIIDKPLNEKQKTPSQKKIKLIKRNFSFQKNEYSVKSTNNYLTTSTSNINTHNNLNSCYDNDNFSESNLNYFSSDKLNKYVLSPINYNSPFSEPSLKKRKRKIIKKGIINSISFKNNSKNKNFKIFSNNIRYNLKYIKNKFKLSSSRNKKFLFNKNKINIIMTQDSSSSNSSNTLSHSSAINSTLIERDNNYNYYNNNYNIINNNNNIDIKNKNSNVNSNNDTFMYNNINKYNRDNDENDIGFIELENKKNNILKIMGKINHKFFNQEVLYNKLKKTLNYYESKINNYKFLINKIKEKNDLLKYKKKIIYNNEKEIIPIIPKIKESKEIENNIINLILKNNRNNEMNKNNNNFQNNIQKYNKNLMIKMIKNLIQNNHDIDSYLNDENKKKLKIICDKYNIFGSIIEDIDE